MLISEQESPQTGPQKISLEAPWRRKGWIILSLEVLTTPPAGPQGAVLCDSFELKCIDLSPWDPATGGFEAGGGARP